MPGFFLPVRIPKAVNPYLSTLFSHLTPAPAVLDSGCVNRVFLKWERVQRLGNKSFVFQCVSLLHFRFVLSRNQAAVPRSHSGLLPVMPFLSGLLT